MALFENKNQRTADNGFIFSFSKISQNVMQAHILTNKYVANIDIKYGNGNIYWPLYDVIFCEKKTNALLNSGAKRGDDGYKITARLLFALIAI